MFSGNRRAVGVLFILFQVLFDDGQSILQRFAKIFREIQLFILRSPMCFGQPIVKLESPLLIIWLVFKNLTVGDKCLRVSVKQFQLRSFCINHNPDGYIMYENRGCLAAEHYIKMLGSRLERLFSHNPANVNSKQNVRHPHCHLRVFTSRKFWKSKNSARILRSWGVWHFFQVLKIPLLSLLKKA